MYSLITDPKDINAAIVTWGRDGKRHRIMGHVVLCSALSHVAKHGNVGILNNLFKVAATNERTMIRNYVRRFQTEMELSEGKFIPVRDEDGGEVQTDVAFLDFAKQEFHVRGGHKNNRERFVEFAEKHLINPTKRWPMFTDINIKAEAMRFDTMSLATRLKALLKNAEKNAENVSPKALKRLKESTDYIVSVADDFAEGAAETAQEAKDMQERGTAFAAAFDKMYAETESDPVLDEPVPVKAKGTGGATIEGNA